MTLSSTICLENPSSASIFLIFLDVLMFSWMCCVVQQHIFYNNKFEKDITVEIHNTIFYFAQRKIFLDNS